MPIEPSDPLRSTAEKQIGVSIPVPLDSRLDALVRRVIDAGERTSRKELLAALLLEASEDPERLTRALRQYRSSEAADAVIAGDDVQAYLEPLERKPGPRPYRLA
ncbi:hypothetical protein [Capillimicrobium parvum]|uniref:hypothetical protein n=1 Tax=Capillimicrobium parvum TaxID=2884022 RepID=UPI00216B4B39|nr:hypothetical protein [Capillimicrobium parvum]